MTNYANNTKHSNEIHDEFHQIATYQKTLNKSQTSLRKIFSLPAYHWVLIAFFAAISCHFLHASILTSLFCVAMIICLTPSLRHKINQKSKHLPKIKKWRLFLFIIIIAINLYIFFSSPSPINVFINVLLCVSAFKLSELNYRRDAYVVLDSSLLILATAFLWADGLLTAINVLVALPFILFAFIALNDDNGKGKDRFQSLALIGTSAIPLLIILFLFFPRIPPLYSLGSANQAVTGISDEISPGDFSNLSKSTDLAFRVEFNGKIPKRDKLYWRGLTLDEFNGKTWRGNIRSYWFTKNKETPSWLKPLQGKPDGSYQIIIEPTNQRWLFGLHLSRAYPTPDVIMLNDHTIAHNNKISKQLHYKADYYANSKIDVDLSAKDRLHLLSLPDGSNPKSRQLANDLYLKSNGDTMTIVQNIHRYIVDNQFRYTLSPPLLNSDDRIDEFLFESKAGFCEHYASSFAFLMRSIGIPTRLVAGYQGGELALDGNSWEVRQMDAHAWTEIWIEGEGWLLVDPTSFISPERIENGMLSLTSNAGNQMFGSSIKDRLAYQHFRLSSNIRSYTDQINYYWQKNIVGFDQDKQKESLLAWLNIASLARQLQFLFGAFILCIASFAFVYWYKNRKNYHALDLPIIKLSKRLQKTPHLQQQTGESPLAYFARLSEHAKSNLPSQANDIDALNDDIQRTYRTYRYGKNEADAKTIHAFAKQVGQLKSYLQLANKTKSGATD